MRAMMTTTTSPRQVQYSSCSDLMTLALQSCVCQAFTGCRPLGPHVGHHRVQHSGSLASCC